MVYLIRQKAILDFLNINPSIVAFMIVAWLLLAIDATLKLGIVERVVGVAKQIKELK
jgi:hypothetical protein